MTLTLNASNLGRVMACPGSVGLARPRSPSEDALEGTAAHEAAAMILRGDVQLAEELADRKAPCGAYITPDMLDHIEDYVTVCTHRDIRIGVEMSADWQTPGGVTVACRVDYASWSADKTTLFIDDLKYGWRLVEPTDNWTLIAYAIGVVMASGHVPQQVTMVVHQPRPWHPEGSMRGWAIPYNHLLTFYEQIVSRLDALDDTVATGPHCYKCEAADSCSAARCAAMASVDVAMSQSALEDLPDDALSAELDILERAADALKLRKDAVEALAIDRITHNREVPGWITAPHYGHRAWNKEITPEIVEMLTGVDVTEKKTVTPAQAEKRGIPREVMDTLAGAPKLGMKLTRGDSRAQVAAAFTKGG